MSGAAIHAANPEGAAVRGLWSDAKFLDQVGSPAFNAKLVEEIAEGTHEREAA